ncbi:MAG: hypothetical protein LBS64_03835 [Spirochaetaceae bacterium]|jgi:hypothetical protein|nr:hypothetical protein [Spirochaetaceae bacterium]
MGYTVIFNGIIFIEGEHSTAVKGRYIECDLSETIYAHLKSLRDVKEVLAQHAKDAGYNAIVNFKYGQRNRWTGSLLQMDWVAFYGNGYLANIPADEYQPI